MTRATAPLGAHPAVSHVGTCVCLAVALGLSLVAARPAKACEPLVRRVQPYPPDMARGVARDTVILGSSAVKVARTGETIVVDPVTLPGMPERAYRPRAPLPPNEEILAGGVRFVTGEALSLPAGDFAVLERTREHHEGNTGGCVTDSCGPRDTYRITVVPSTTAPPTLFAAVQAGPANAFDSSKAPFSILYDATWKGGNGQLLEFNHLPDGGVIYLVPLTAAGMLGTPIGPIDFDDEGGCTLGQRFRSRISPLPFVLLVGIALALRTRRRR